MCSTVEAAACRALRIGFWTSPAGSVRTHEMQGNTLQGMLEIAAATYWVSANYVATDPLRDQGDYQALPAAIAETIGTSNSS